MNIMHRKKVTLLAALTTTTMAVVMAVVFASNGMDLYSVRGQSEVVNGSITWNASSQKTVHQSNRVSYHSKTNGGMDLVLYAYGQYDYSNTCMFNSKKSGALDYGIYINASEGSGQSLFQFQGITSVSITTDAGSDSGATFAIYTDSTASGSAVVSETVDSSEHTYTYTTEVSGAHYLAIKPTHLSYIVKIKSVTVNYSCEPGGGEPVVDEYSISYIGMDSDYNPIPLVGIDESSLVTKAEEGSTVHITPVALSGYQYLGSFESTEYIEDYAENAGVISFTMPSANVTLCLVTQSSAVTLSSIEASGYTTEFTVGDTFAFGGTVTAHYSDSTSANVTASATFSGYDMSTAGNQTVTVSYTEGGVNKTTTYGISVSSGTPEPEEVVLNGKYTYSSREGSGDNYPSWPNMYIEFTSDGKALWHNERPYYSTGTYSCDMYFTYTAINDGTRINISMARDADRTPHHSGYYGYWFLLDGAEKNSESAWSGYGYDRPIDSGFTVDFKNNSGVMNLAKTSLTIDVYDKSHSYAVYDTFTFTLAA